MKRPNLGDTGFCAAVERDNGRISGKSVEFLCEVEGRLLLLTGRFFCLGNPDRESVVVRYTGRLGHRDAASSDYVFPVSSFHLRSTIPATRAGAFADFLMERPLKFTDSSRLHTTPEPRSAALAV